MIELEAAHSHLYPGARGRVRAGDPAAAGPVTVTFADASRALGALAGGRLALASYRTAAGTAVAPRGWQLRFAEDPEGATFRVTARCPDAP